MSTKLIINGKPGEPINGNNMFIEVDGVRLSNEIRLNVTANCHEVATVEVVILLPEIEYREE